MLLKVVHSRIARSRSVSVVAMVATAQVGCAGICREPTMCEAASRAICGCGETHLGGRSPGRVRGGLNAGLTWGSSLAVILPVGDPGLFSWPWGLGTLLPTIYASANGRRRLLVGSSWCRTRWGRQRSC